MDDNTKQTPSPDETGADIDTDADLDTGAANHDGARDDHGATQSAPGVPGEAVPAEGGGPLP